MTPKGTPSASYTFGKNSVLALLKASPERVYKILLAQGLKPDKRLNEIRDLAREAGIALQTVDRKKLDSLTQQGEAHQGIAASVAPKALLDIEELLTKCRQKITQGEQPLVLLLDEVTDPRNFGAILRVVDAAGADGVVIAKHRSASFGPAVAKTASGAEAVVDVAVVSNLSQAMQKLKDAGFWVIGAANAPEATLYHKQDVNMPVVLAMGSEGKGLSRNLVKNCDFLVKIPMRGTVDSLNVAAATAVLVFDVVTRRT